MLRNLYIHDFAIVSSLELDFAMGMTALTGETGAGKSILLDALDLCLGDSADSGWIRAGCARAEVTAVFDPADQPEAQDWLEAQALGEAGECILRRVLERDRRSRAFINGRPVAAAQLQALGQLLVDIHGQHAHQSLSRPAQQRRLLDEFAGQQTQVMAVTQAFRRYRELREQLAALTAQAGEGAERRERLNFQIGELERLKPVPGEWAPLHEEQRRLQNVEQLQIAGQRLEEGLFEGHSCVQRQLSRFGHELGQLLDFDARLKEALELLEGARIQVEESAAAIRRFIDRLEPDPQRLMIIESRLSELHDLARQHRITPEELPDRLMALQTERQRLDRTDDDLENLTASLVEARAAFLGLAGRLGQVRREAAARLSITISEAMQRLGMTGGRFVVDVEALSEDEAGSHGLDQVTFRVSANPGQPLQPLAKVASGGELSRISLAIQVATAACGRIPTLIYDEVDVGIGGRVAEIVGQLLKQVSANRQVLCVTHLPQVACHADHHFQVIKHTQDGQTFATIKHLDEPRRVEEIARMLGGVDITHTTRRHAREMRDKAQGREGLS